jgi:hypothetical protein
MGEQGSQWEFDQIVWIASRWKVLKSPSVSPGEPGLFSGDAQRVRRASTGAHQRPAPARALGGLLYHAQRQNCKRTLRRLQG